MKVFHWLSAASIAWGISALPASASPQISSGDGIINADITACLSRTDAFVETLNVNIERGEIVRTGYFNDGSFRILCYPNPYSETEQSLVVVFVAHETDLTVADTFVQIALSKIADPERVAPQSSRGPASSS
jgi:hypothetical protein